MNKTCPKCRSEKTKTIKYLNIDVIKCLSCGYDGSESYEVYPEQKASGQKGKYNPYKIGGPRRTQKR